MMDDLVRKEIEDMRRDRAKRMRPFVGDRWLLANVIIPEERQVVHPTRGDDKTMAAVVDHFMQPGVPLL